MCGEANNKQINSSTVPALPPCLQLGVRAGQDATPTSEPFSAHMKNRPGPDGSDRGGGHPELRTPLAGGARSRGLPGARDATEDREPHPQALGPPRLPARPPGCAVAEAGIRATG